MVLFGAASTFNRTVATCYRIALEQRRYASSTINLKLVGFGLLRPSAQLLSGLLRFVSENAVGCDSPRWIRIMLFATTIGGRLVYGTDTGFLTDYDQGEEFRQLMVAGFGFRDVLTMLTTAPAELFRLSAREGKVIPGMRGDLTILSEDPPSGRPEAFTNIRYTIRAGKVIWEANQATK